MDTASIPGKHRRAWSLGTKMSLIMAAIVFVCTLGVVISVLSYNLRLAVNAEHQRLNSVSGIFRAVLSEPVAAGNRGEAMEALRALKDIPTLLQASVRNTDGGLIAEMGGGAVLDRKVLHTDKFSLLDLWSMETLQATDDIVKGGRTVGTLRLTADISWLAKEFQRNLLVALGAAALGILLAFAAGTFLIKRSTRQLSRLADDLSDIGGQEKLTLGVKRETDDEVGVLVDAFNDMMGRIELRDQALRRHSETLEATVAERTHELVIARDEAESANAAKSEFLAMMSHEIRTPMNGMMVMAQMLAAAPLSPRHLRFAEIINRSGQNLLAIINDVLDISKIESGKLTLEYAPFKIDDILADAHGLFCENARERGLELTYHVSPEVPDEVEGDSARLNQVVTNLINNALKFTERGGVSVGVSAKSNKGQCLLCIEVKDTGIGIAADKLKFVFERFAQADQSITRRFGGTGLGLAISRNLVEAMGGEISVSSREGHGSVFKVLLPVGGKLKQVELPLKGRAIVLDLPGQLERENVTATLIGAGATVLVADDLHHEPAATCLLSADPLKVARSKIPAFLLEPVIDSVETGILNRNRLVLNFPFCRQDLARFAAALESGDYSHFRALKRTQEKAASYDMYRGLHALAVDDNKVNRDVLCEVLHSLGMTVETAANGEDAVTAAKDRQFDIIFMDCSMPVMDGFAATRIIREQETGKSRRVPVVAITALGAAAGKQDWLDAGMDGWISKPFTIPSVTSALSTLVLGTNAKAGKDKDNAFARFAAIPELDEQTLGMIARLSEQGDGKQAAVIFGLFEMHGNQTCATICELLNNGIAENLAGRETLIDNAEMLTSMATSIGAARLASMASELAATAKRGDAPSAEMAESIKSTFELALAHIAGRLAIVPERPKAIKRLN